MPKSVQLEVGLAREGRNSKTWTDKTVLTETATPTLRAVAGERSVVSFAGSPSLTRLSGAISVTGHISRVLVLFHLLVVFSFKVELFRIIKTLFVLLLLGIILIHRRNIDSCESIVLLWVEVTPGRLLSESLILMKGWLGCESLPGRFECLRLPGCGESMNRGKSRFWGGGRRGPPRHCCSS